MLTDAFVPLFTYPEEFKLDAQPRLAALLGNLATRVTYCAVEVEIPNLADRWGAALVALPAMAAQIERRSSECAAGLLKGVAALDTKFRGETMSIRAVAGSQGRSMAQLAHHHDVTALSMRRGSAERQAIAEEFIFSSGRPLLLLPEGVEYDTDLVQVAIAWDGGPTAARAVYDAMPMITRARDVSILVAHENKPVSKEATAALIRYLDRHDVAARVTEVGTAKRQIALDLQNAALSGKQSIMVMGGYGHSRLREFVLGGATAGVLRDTLLPIFMSR